MSKKVKLVVSFWRDGHKPGDEIELSDEDAKIWVRDGHAKYAETKKVEPQNKKADTSNK